MNTYYHVDTTDQLRTGLIIELDPGRASTFGKNYHRRFQAAGITNQLEQGRLPPIPHLLTAAAYREYFIELFRLHSPHLKDLKTVSRLNSFFAFRSTGDAKRYLERHKAKKPPKIYAIHCEGDHPAFDMTWLDYEFPRNISAFEYYYTHYWKGLLISEDVHLATSEKRGSLVEILITSSVTIGEQVIDS